MHSIAWFMQISGAGRFERLGVVWRGPWTFFTIGSHLVGLVDVLNDWATFSVSQSFETSILISQSPKTSIQGLDL